VKEGRRVAKFVGLKDSAQGAPLAVNPDHVVMVAPSADDDSITILYLQNGTQQPVQGAYADVVKMLTA
jgi:hypothetical protein